MTGYSNPDEMERIVLDALKDWPLYAWEISRIAGYGDDGRSLIPVLRRLERKGLVRKRERSPHSGAWRWESILDASLTTIDHIVLHLTSIKRLLPVQERMKVNNEIEVIQRMAKHITDMAGAEALEELLEGVGE